MAEEESCSSDTNLWDHPCYKKGCKKEASPCKYCSNHTRRCGDHRRGTKKYCDDCEVHLFWCHSCDKFRRQSDDFPKRQFWVTVEGKGARVNICYRCYK